MTTGIFLAVGLLVMSTSFLSGVLGMAGGMILMGALLAMMPVAAAMVLQSVAQLAANTWRAFLWREHTDWRIVGRFAIGASLALAIMLSIRFVPSRTVVLLMLGISPFLALAVPARYAPQAQHRLGAETCGFICQTLHLVSGVTGPILDIFFVRSLDMDRRAVVATKATTQVIGHSSKLLYFGGMLSSGTLDLHWLQWAAVLGLAMTGTTLSRIVLERISDAQFRQWTRVIVLMVGSVYLVQGIASFW